MYDLNQVWEEVQKWGSKPHKKTFRLQNPPTDEKKKHFESLLRKSGKRFVFPTWLEDTVMVQLVKK